MKAVILVLSPEECYNLFNGNLSVLVRKKFSKDYVGWVYIYCTKGNKNECLIPDLQPDKVYHPITEALHRGVYSFVEEELIWNDCKKYILNGKDSWLREKHEYRYARSIDWAKTFFNFKTRPYTGFQVYTILDKTYRQHFINAGIPGEAFDLLQYTGLHIIIDYSK